MQILKTVAATLVAGMAVLTPTSAQALQAPTTVADPGPAGDFNWEGYNWAKRSWTGGPHYNGKFDPANVSGPDANGHITLTLTNPTGNAPVAAEMQTTKRGGWGYGTYTTVIEKDLSTLQDEVVWGCLFTYDPSTPLSANEIDVCETSAWGGGAAYGQNWDTVLGHGYWIDATKAPGNDVDVFPVTTDPILTHRMVWEPGKITFETFIGEGTAGQLLRRTVKESSTVPVPANEALHFNLWVTGGGGGTPDRVKSEKVVIRDFSFTPAAATAPVVVAPTPAPSPTPTPSPTPAVSPIKLTASVTKSKSSRTTTLKWTGATGTSVTLVANGVRKTVPNTGTWSVTSKRSAITTYQICDTAGCSTAVKVST